MLFIFFTVMGSRKTVHIHSQGSMLCEIAASLCTHMDLGFDRLTDRVRLDANQLSRIMKNMYVVDVG